MLDLYEDYIFQSSFGKWKTFKKQKKITKAPYRLSKKLNFCSLLDYCFRSVSPKPVIQTRNLYVFEFSRDCIVSFFAKNYSSEFMKSKFFIFYSKELIFSSESQPTKIQANDLLEWVLEFYFQIYFSEGQNPLLFIISI